MGKQCRVRVSRQDNSVGIRQRSFDEIIDTAQIIRRKKRKFRFEPQTDSNGCILYLIACDMIFLSFSRNRMEGFKEPT